MLYAEDVHRHEDEGSIRMRIRKTNTSATENHQHKIVLLTTSFQERGRRLFFARARLYPDRIELSGWQPGHTYQEQILLARIARIDWPDAAAPDADIVLHLQDDTRRVLRLKKISAWRRLLESRLRWRNAAPLRANRPAPLPMKDLVTYTSGLG